MGRIKTERKPSNTLPEIGKIKIGMKHPQKGYPMSVDYFIASGNYVNEFKTQFGEKPKKLSIAFISNDVTEACNERFEAYVKGKRYGWGNGETFTVFDPKKGEKGGYVEVTAGDPRLKGLPWKHTLTLRFVILDLPGIMGYWSLQTMATETSIPTIVNTFDHIKRQANDNIIGFPFNLIVEKKTGYHPTEPKSYPMVSLVPNFTENEVEKVRSYIEAGGDVTRLSPRAISGNSKLLQIEQ